MKLTTPGRSVLLFFELILLLFAPLPGGSHAEGGVRGDVDSTDNEDEVIVKRFLAYSPPQPPPRCPFPDEDPGECELFLDFHECCDVCFVCPCFDGTFYDYYGDEITDLCKEGSSCTCYNDPCDRRPEKRRELCGDRCRCTRCDEDKIIVLPQDDERCQEPVSTTTTTTSTTISPPEGCRYDHGSCVGPCDKGEGDCLNSPGVSCKCSLVDFETCECKNPCDEIKYKWNQNNVKEYLCDVGFCEDIDFTCKPKLGSKYCGCEPVVCTFVSGEGCVGPCDDDKECILTGDRECGCMEKEIPVCEYDEVLKGCTDGPCGKDEDCILVDEKECECKPVCAYDKNSGECLGSCPFDAGDGVSCVRTGPDACGCESCEEAYPEETASGDLECNADCPEGDGEGCVPTSKTTCGCGCTWDNVEEECIGFCPFDASDGVSCVRTGPADCACESCEAAYPETDSDSGMLVCNADCPEGEGDTVGCVPTSDMSCGCDPFCEEVFPVPDGSNGFRCNGICPGDGSGPGCEPTNDNTECACPTCELEIVKTCKVTPTPPPTPSSKDGGKCKDISELTLVWRGSAAATVSADTSGLTLRTQSGTSTVQPGETITLGPFSGNDQVFNVNTGSSTFHMSCSDSDMNSPDDCSKPQGNGKDGKSKGNAPISNEWFIVSLVADEGGFDCPENDPNNGNGGDGGDGDGVFKCEIISNNPNCDSKPKPKTVTWLYNGGSDPDDQCDSSTIRDLRNEKGKEHKDFSCGPDNVFGPIRVESKDDFVGTFGLGGEFRMDLKDIKEMTLTDNSGNRQELTFHTSCSQPIEVGMTAGALTLVAFDNRRGSNEVRYFYEVRNVGNVKATDITVEDNRLGFIGTIDSLDPDESITLDARAILDTTTTNIATTVGTSSGGECSDTSNEVTVSVKVIRPR